MTKLEVNVTFFLVTLRRKTQEFEKIVGSKEIYLQIQRLRRSAQVIESLPDPPDDSSDGEEIKESTERQLQNLEELQASVRAIAEQQKSPSIQIPEPTTQDFWMSDLDSEEHEGERQYRPDSRATRKKLGETVKPVLR